ncbi:MAG: hypothetical protein JJU33_14865 [Phycisphaerales bacterium]|nr:hypothetical protein [Phycisphaerales bacterium]
MTPQDLHQLAETFVSLLDWPSAVVAGADEIVVCNEPWSKLTGAGPSSELESSLRGFSSIEPLIGSLRAGSPTVGSITTARTPDVASMAEMLPVEYTIRWRRLYMSPDDRALALIVLQDHSEVEHLASVISSQRLRINQLLVRQTIIEETERRRLGRALHDVVSQNLGRIRMDVKRLVAAGVDADELLATIDRVIEDTRTLAFELSPPVLEDLGVIPAVQWLAEHLNKRYRSKITVDEVDREPRLSHETRTIVFRAIRELAINAAKHAEGSEVVISCSFGDRVVSFTVSDSGPGFDVATAFGGADGVQRFGLLSVEQQIRGIGGVFELVSNVGEGTRATVTVALQPEKGGSHDEPDDRRRR